MHFAFFPGVASFVGFSPSPATPEKHLEKEVEDAKEQKIVALAVAFSPLVLRAQYPSRSCGWDESLFS